MLQNLMNTFVKFFNFFQSMQTVRFISRNKNLFFHTLKGRVDNYFSERGLDPYANRQMVLKTFILLSLYIIPFAVFCVFAFPVWANALLWAIMGVAMAGIGMSVMHDACHGAYSSNNFVNRITGYTLNLLGGSVHNWKLQHNVLHHTYTNIAHMDHDVDDKVFFRFTPHSKRRWIHQYQYIYAFIFYGILSLYWVTIKDFAQFFRYIYLGVNRYSVFQNAKILFRIILMKAGYFGVMFGIPMFTGHAFYEILGCFLLMQGISGLILTTIFQMAHTVEGTTHPLPSETGNIDNDWAIHQMHTTCNFAPRNRWLSWYIGGLNYQIEHHLFTKICHVHYPAIAPIVRETAQEFGVPYLQQPTFGKALRSHIALLQQLGHLPS